VLVCLISFGKIAAAQDAHQSYNIGFENNLLSISAREADLKKVLFKVADKTDTVVQVPGSLDKEISITIKNLSIKEAFHRLLKEFNYVVIYSGKEKSKADIQKVIVFEAPKKVRRTKRTNNRIARTIRSLERRLETLKRSLSRVKEGSPRGKSYVARIRRIENQIAKLKGRMN
jgi:hypothetical protein